LGEDEARTLDGLRQLRKELFEPVVSEYRGNVVKRMGDGWLVEFPSVVDAVNCAMAVQRGLTGHDIITIRVGIHIGDVVFEDDDIFGDGVNIAARLEATAQPGEVLISDTAHHSLDGKLAQQFGGGDSLELKNIARPVRVWRWSTSSETAATPSDTEQLPLPDKPSIAVLPFNNMSSDPEQEYFADGISEEIITALSKIENLFVVARNSTFTYKGQAVDIKRVGREQGVRYVLEGSVRQGGNRLRITAQLIDAATGNHLWADRYDGENSDVFALQDEITREVAAALQVELTEGEQARLWASGTKNLEAWELAIQASFLIHEHHREGVHEAHRLAEHAVRLDENYAWAWAMLSVAHWSSALNEGWSDSREGSLTLAMDANDRSLAIDPSSPDALMIRGLIQLTEQKFNDALALSEKALLLAPNHAHNTAIAAIIVLCCGEFQGAVDLTARAIRLCPIFPSWYLVMRGRAYWAMGRTDEAIAAARSAIEYDPDLSYAYLTLIKVLAESGREDEALRAAGEVLRIDPGFSVTAWVEGMPYRDPELRSRQNAALCKAGLPE
jgi:adenylate cyclase